MKSVAGVLAASILCAVICPAFTRAEAGVCSVARSAMADASSIRKLRVRQNVPCFVHNQEQVKRYLLDSIATKIPKQKIEYEDFVYKALGFIPGDFDYKNGIIELYLSQIGGYYDPDKNHFVMAGWVPALMQTTVAVHELTHALQDQYYNLDAFIDMKIENSDALLARSALVEGDATAVMLDYTRKLSGQRPLVKDKDVEGIMMQNLLGVALLPAMSSAPKSLQLTLLFPYTSGLRFAHFLLRKGGYNEIDKSFARPPRSTEEILHPQKYLTAEPDFAIPSDEEALGAGYANSGAIVYRDVMGEFSISALLAMVDQNNPAIADAAAGWGGDKVVLLNAAGGKMNLIWLTRWDTPQDAQEFFKLYAKTLAKRFAGAHFSESSTKWTGSDAGRKLGITLEQREVRVEIG